jgi:TolB-like protein/tetratricopeptide (TPR) repeat protein
MVGMEPPVSASKWVWPTVVVAAVVVTLIGYQVYQEIAGPKLEPASVEKMAYDLPDKPSIAVLPFDNMSGDPDQIYIADGISENITAALSKIPELFVISRNSTFKYKGKPVEVRQIAEDLGVRYVLEGSIQKSGERLRVTAQLIDALKGYHVWSEKYDRKLDHFFIVQDDIALNIAVSLQVKLTEGEQARVRHSTENLEAWALAVEAHGLFETYTRENIAKARELFMRAVELDPNYAYAWTYLGWTYWIDGAYHSAHYDREKCFENASEMATRAMDVDPKSSDAHALLGSIYLSKKKFDEAETFGRKTIDLDPNSSENHAIVAITMQNIGEFEEAIALLKQAMRLDPFFPDWYLARLGMCYQMMGMYEESVEAFDELAKRYRESKAATPWDRFYLYLAATYSMMGRLEEAQDCVSKALEYNPKMTVDLWRARLQYKNPEHTERILGALRNAGLPENPPLPIPDKPSIAVLPFDNLSGDPGQEYFSDGITEHIITSLSKVPYLFVIARNSTFSFKDKNVKVQQIAEELGVRYILEGSVQRSGDRVRISAQLIDATGGYHLWADSFDRKVDDIFSLQDEIAMKIMAELQVKLTVDELGRISAIKTKNIKAYEKYLLGYEHFERRTEADSKQAKMFAEEAISLDPKYGAPYLLLAETHLDDVWYYKSKSVAESLEIAERLVKKAVKLSGQDAAAHQILCSVYHLRRQYDQAVEEGKKAINLSPNSAEANFRFGHALRWAGRFDEAILAYNRAIRLNPITPIRYISNLAWAYAYSGNYQKAITFWNQSIERNPDYFFAHFGLTIAHQMSGNETKAREAATEVLRLKPKLTVSQLKKGPTAKNWDREPWSEALRKAGIPE